MHTHCQFVRVQGGATTPAVAKPEKKNKDINGAAARSGIWCLAAVRVVGQKGTEDALKKSLD